MSFKMNLSSSPIHECLQLWRGFLALHAQDTVTSGEEREQVALKLRERHSEQFAKPTQISCSTYRGRQVRQCSRRNTGAAGRSQRTRLEAAAVAGSSATGLAIMAAQALD